MVSITVGLIFDPRGWEVACEADQEGGTLIWRVALVFVVIALGFETIKG